MADNAQTPCGKPISYGRYELLERIGVGGMAEVFRARLPGVAGFEKQVVVKKLQPKFRNDARFKRMFVEEAKLAGQVQHKNVVQVFELGHHDGELFMVLEYVPGTDLKRLLREASVKRLSLPLWLSVHITIEVLEALAFAHDLRDGTGQRRNLVHCDVTPENIFLSAGGEVKLGDFGVAHDDTRSEDDFPGEVRGKLAYMAPEQLSGRLVDQRADVFSIGVVLWESLAQRRLFRASTDDETVARICHEDRPAPSLYNQKVPPSLDAAVLGALRADRTRRTRTARELQQALVGVQIDLKHRVALVDVERALRKILTAPVPSIETNVEKNDPSKTPTVETEIPSEAARKPEGQVQWPTLPPRFDPYALLPEPEPAKVKTDYAVTLPPSGIPTPTNPVTPARGQSAPSVPQNPPPPPSAPEERALSSALGRGPRSPTPSTTEAPSDGVRLPRLPSRRGSSRGPGAMSDRPSATQDRGTKLPPFEGPQRSASKAPKIPALEETRARAQRASGDAPPRQGPVTPSSVPKRAPSIRGDISARERTPAPGQPKKPISVGIGKTPLVRRAAPLAPPPKPIATGSQGAAMEATMPIPLPSLSAGWTAALTGSEPPRLPPGHPLADPSPLAVAPMHGATSQVETADILRGPSPPRGTPIPSHIRTTTNPARATDGARDGAAGPGSTGPVKVLMGAVPADAPGVWLRRPGSAETGPRPVPDALTVLRRLLLDSPVLDAQVSVDGKHWKAGTLLARLLGEEIVPADGLLPMTEDRGPLRETSLVAIFGRLAREELSGRLIIVLDRPGRPERYELYVHRGRLFHVASSRSLFAAWRSLLSSPQVQQPQLRLWITKVIRESQPFELVAAAPAVEAVRAQQAHFAQDDLQTLFSERNGRYAFAPHPSPPSPNGSGHALLTLLPSLVSRACQISDLERRLLSRLAIPMVRSDGFETEAAQLGLSNRDAAALDRFVSGQPLRHALAEPSDPRMRKLTLVLAYTLSELGLLRPCIAVSS